MATKQDKSKFHNAKRHAFNRGVEWHLSFEEWYNWWQSTGYYDQRGPFKDQYCMARLGDIGPYALDNIKCITNSENVLEARSHDTIIYKRGDKPTAIPCVCEGKRFDCLQDAADYYNMSYQAIVYRIKSKNFSEFTLGEETCQ